MGRALPEVSGSICSLGMGQTYHICVYVGSWAQQAALTHRQQQGQEERQPPILHSVWSCAQGSPMTLLQHSGAMPALFGPHNMSGSSELQAAPSLPNMGLSLRRSSLCQIPLVL